MGSANDPLLVKGALTDAQLQDAITQVIGPAGFSAAEANDGLDEEVDGENDAAASYSDVWADPESVDGGMQPYQELDMLFDGPVSEEVGRADVRALEAMHSRLQQSQSSEARTDGLSTVTDGALPLEEAEEAQPVAQEEAVLLPEIKHPSKCKPHRLSNDTSAFLEPVTESSRFLDRWAVFSKQLHSWGYHGAPIHLKLQIVFDVDPCCLYTVRTMLFAASIFYCLCL